MQQQLIFSIFILQNQQRLNQVRSPNQPHHGLISPSMKNQLSLEVAPRSRWDVSHNKSYYINSNLISHIGYRIEYDARKKENHCDVHKEPKYFVFSTFQLNLPSNFFKYTFGCIQTCMDTFRYVWISSDTFRYVQIHFDMFGYSWIGQIR